MSRRRIMRRHRLSARLFEKRITAHISQVTAAVPSQFKMLRDVDPLDYYSAAIDEVGARTARNEADRILLTATPGGDTWVRLMWLREPPQMGAPDVHWPPSTITAPAPASKA